MHLYQSRDSEFIGSSLGPVYINEEGMKERKRRDREKDRKREERREREEENVTGEVGFESESQIWDLLLIQLCQLVFLKDMFYYV